MVRVRLVGIALLFVLVGAAVRYMVVAPEPEPQPGAATVEQMRAERQAARDAILRYALYDSLKPVKLANCEFQRFGESNDGGYVMCGNLLGDARAGYSYGISNYDKWGCDISTGLNVPVHQYDCFDMRQPSCPTGRTIFHPECIASRTFTEDGRPFDTLAHQLQKNGDAGRHIVVKMDVEGAEWDALLEAPDEVLASIDQLAIELHGVADAKFEAVAERLNRFFHVANVHFNNFSCQDGIEPFPAWAYEVLFVSRRIAVLDPSAQVAIPSPFDAPNEPGRADCQGWRAGERE